MIRKFAIVGTGGRHQMFREAVAITHAESAELVALCDVNQSRLALSAASVPDRGGNGIATYLAEDFDKMLSEQEPDTVIVTVPDYLHDEYIVRALEAGRNVMTEKPMTMTLTTETILARAPEVILEIRSENIPVGPQLQAEIDKHKASALLVVPGASAATVKALWEISQDNQLYALALDAETVQSSFPLGVSMVGDKPQIIINEKSSKAVGARFETVVLRMAKVIQ